MTDNYISPNTMRMLQDEAVAVFNDRTKSMAFKSRTGQVNQAVARAVEHALHHALEEGIVRIPTETEQFHPTEEEVQQFLRDQEITKKHEEIPDDTQRPETIDSIRENGIAPPSWWYHPPIMDIPSTWIRLAHEVADNGTTEAAQELAQKILRGQR